MFASLGELRAVEPGLTRAEQERAIRPTAAAHRFGAAPRKSLDTTKGNARADRECRIRRRLLAAGRGPRSLLLRWEPVMRYRLLGRTGLRVSEAFLGTMTFGQDWGWGAGPDECRAMFSAYAEAGGNVIDTANR